MQQLQELVAQLAKYFASQMLFFFSGMKGRHQVKVMICHEKQMADVNFYLLVLLNMTHGFHRAKKCLIYGGDKVHSTQKRLWEMINHSQTSAHSHTLPILIVACECLISIVSVSCPMCFVSLEYI